MATVEKRTSSNGTVSWRARVRKQGYPSRTKTFKRKTDATTWARSLERTIDKGGSIPDSASARHSVAAAITRYINDTLPNTDRNKDARNVEKRLAWWKDELGEYALSKVTRSTLTSARDKLLRTRKPATVRNYMHNLSAVFQAAVMDWGWLEYNPMHKVRKPGGRQCPQSLSVQ